MGLKTTDPQRLVEAVGAWLQYEQLCRRNELFSESYLTYSVGQFLQARAGRDLRSEYPHPVLTENDDGRGDKKRIDYVVLREDKTVRFAVETKWKNKSARLTETIIQDLVRLHMLAEKHNATALLVFGGQLNRIWEMFKKKPHAPENPSDHKSKHMLPVEERYTKRSVRLKTTSPIRRPLMKRALWRFRDYELPESIHLTRLGPFPRNGRMNQAAVFGFRVNVRTHSNFRPSDEFEY